MLKKFFQYLLFKFLPVGTVKVFNGTNLPQGWFTPGTLLKKAEYMELYALLKDGTHLIDRGDDFIIPDFSDLQHMIKAK